jgi:cytidine deaminase
VKIVAPTEDRIQWLLEEATTVAGHAYAPYSKYHVGAALVTDDDQLVTGCNVENGSYGLSMCAERNAIFRAVTMFGNDFRPRAMAVVLENGEPISPCGACRQVMMEFNPDMLVVFRSPDGVEQRSVRDLLPNGFAFR